jgi:hypothetical protein
MPNLRVAADLQAFDDEVARMRRAFDALPGDPNDREWVKRKLAHMSAVDQFMRLQIDVLRSRGYSDEEAGLFWEGFGGRWESIDRGNQAELEKLLELYEWFKISEFGPEAEADAWLLAQHADHDLRFQKRILSILERLLPSGETSGTSFAYLYDRVAVAENRPQRFGTQGRCVGPGRWEPWPSEEPQALQARRDALGLGPIEENIRRVSEQCRGPEGG